MILLPRRGNNNHSSVWHAIQPFLWACALQERLTYYVVLTRFDATRGRCHLWFLWLPSLTSAVLYPSRILPVSLAPALLDEFLIGVRSVQQDHVSDSVACTYRGRGSGWTRSELGCAE